MRKVLCACGDGHSVVRLLAPPADSAIGARVTFPGFPGEPASSSQVAKKKVLEGLLPDLHTDDKGEGMFILRVLGLRCVHCVHFLYVSRGGVG